MKPDNFIYDTTVKSQVGPIQDHLIVAGAAVNYLVSFFEVAIAGDWNRARELKKKIREMEAKSQGMKKRLRLQLPKHLVLSELCGELIELLTLQNDVAGRARDIAALIFARRMEFPVGIQKMLITLVHSTVMITEYNLQVIDEFDQCLATQRDQNESRVVENLVKELDRLERSTDQLALSIRAKLFKLESDLEAVELVLLHRVIDSISALAERSQTVGFRLQLLLA